MEIDFIKKDEKDVETTLQKNKILVNLRLIKVNSLSSLKKRRNIGYWEVNIRD